MLVQTIPISRRTLSAKCLSRSDRPRFSGGHERIGDSAWLLSRHTIIPRTVEIGIQEDKPEVYGFMLYEGLKDREVWCPISDRSVFLNKVSEDWKNLCRMKNGTVPGRLVYLAAEQSRESGWFYERVSSFWPRGRGVPSGGP